MLKNCFGKRSKTPEQNATCFLYACSSILSTKEVKKSSKEMKKYVKYKDRLTKILNGQFTKVPNTLANKLKIA